jgi:2-C-methyl-D-erythritol 4-phosphate cytidylyltransferase
MGAEKAKQYLPLAGRPILLHTLERLAQHPRVVGLVLVLCADDAHWPLPGFSCAKPLQHVVGGASRAASVLVALDLLAGQLPADAPLLVHDAVRPLLHASDLDRLCALPLDDHGCLLAMPVTDTVKRADADGRVLATIAREGLYTAQTPQRFRLGLLRGALQAALASGEEPSDEAQAVEICHSPSACWRRSGATRQ